MSKKLKKDFYINNTLDVAKSLLGKILVHKSADGIAKGKIVEVEAYLGAKDKAAHTYNYRRTKRTEIQFNEGGFAYIYFIYGCHYCLNIVTSIKGEPESVLIRALEPIDGISLMQKRRNTENLINLCNGPGKLCQAMGLNKDQNGIDLMEDILYLEDSTETFEIISSKRINIEYAEEAKDYEWRFYIKENKFISKKQKNL